MRFFIKFLKICLAFLFKKKRQVFSYIFLLSVFLFLVFATVFIKNEIYFSNIKRQKIDTEIEKEKEKYEYLINIFLNLTSYEKLIQIVDIEKFEKDNNTIAITILE